MKLTVFQSKDGDCILVTGADGKMVLADGGRSSSYSDNVAAELAKLKPKESDFEAVYISHIDADHVEGIEKMLGDLIDWARFDFQSSQTSGGNVKPPGNPRPIRPKKFWHNSFHDQVSENAGEIVDMLAASAATLSALPASAPAFLWSVALEHADLANSTRQAYNISTRIRKNLLNITLNPEFNGKLMLLASSKPKFIKVGEMKWRIIGPGEQQLKELRDDWNEWLESSDGAKAIKAVKEQAAKDQGAIGNSVSEVPQLMAQRSLEATLLAQTFLDNQFGLSSNNGGARNGITVPNLASLMFLVEEGIGKKKRRVLMTGDAHWIDIVDGLKKQKLFDKDGNLHVNVLKVQHHGATGNMDPEFLKKVTADHYVFCGISKRHENPEKQVVTQVLDSRLVNSKKGTHAKVDDKFKLWFSGSSANKDLGSGDQTHMKMIEKTITARADAARFEVFYLDGGPAFEIEV